ncbi:hypothetical protein Tco_0006163 [Tanacetum coccineum]
MTLSMAIEVVGELHYFERFNVFKGDPIAWDAGDALGLHYGIAALKDLVTRPRDLIPLRPNLGVLQIGIKSQGYREPDYYDNKSSDDENDDDFEKDEEDGEEEEEEHLAPADPSTVPTDDPVPSR